jgi:Fe-S-cluster containining protein
MSTSISPDKPRREDLPKDVNLCDHCSAKCCKYFALPIDVPDEPTDLDHIRWYLLHERASVFTEENEWYLLVHTTCKHLQADNLCGIYHTRPQICRDYSTNNCEYEDFWTYDRYFESPEQVTEYYEAIVSDTSATIRSAKPDPLAVIS